VKRFICLVCLFAACKGPGYRDPGDTEELRREIGDRNTATRVRIALGEDPQTAPYASIRVECVGGTVTLQGEVRSGGVKRRAVEVARSCEGVRDVRDRISVRDASAPR